MRQLSGIRIAVTRPAAQSAELVALLRAAEADVVICPLIRIEPRVDAEAFRRVLRNFGEYSWLVFTSANGVDQFIRLMAEAATPITGQQIACVGPATAAAAERHGLVTDAIPQEFTGGAVARMLAGRGSVVGKRILIARAAGGGEALPRELRRAGAVVDDLELYRSVADEQGAGRLQQLIAGRQIDVVTFTAGSAVRYFVKAVGVSAQLTIAAIGPSTAAVAGELGLRVDIVANPHTSAGLVTAIFDYFAAGGGKREDRCR